MNEYGPRKTNGSMPSCRAWCSWLSTLSSRAKRPWPEGHEVATQVLRASSASAVVSVVVDVVVSVAVRVVVSVAVSVVVSVLVA